MVGIIRNWDQGTDASGVRRRLSDTLNRVAFIRSKVNDQKVRCLRQLCLCPRQNERDVIQLDQIRHLI